jgi:hypothetical protein
MRISFSAVPARAHGFVSIIPRCHRISDSPLALAFGPGGKDPARTILEKRFKKDGHGERDELTHL